MQIKITDATDYKWIEVGEVYNVTERSKYGFYIKVFGVEFHVLEDDCELVMTDYQQLQLSVDASLKVIEKTTEFEATLHHPSYESSLQQLHGISLVLIPFPDLLAKVEATIEELKNI